MENGRLAITKLNGEGLQNVEAIEIDISKRTSVDDAKNKVQTRFDKLDILINNAGIRGVYPQIPSTVNIESVKQVYETNLFGTI